MCWRPDSYSASFWYRTTATLTHVPGLTAFSYASNNCTGPSFSLGNLNAPSTVSDGAWHAVSGTLTVPFAAQSLQFEPFFACACSQSTTATVNFDDVAFQTGPLAVTVASLSARHVAKGIRLRWRTEAEVDLLGFQVYRSRGHSWKRLNRSLIVANGSVSGASYRFLDRTARRGVAYRYRIKAVNHDGTTSWFGPVRVT